MSRIALLRISQLETEIDIASLIEFSLESRMHFSLKFESSVSRPDCTLVQHAIFSLKRPRDLCDAGAFGKV
jgi:hypothetical protein